MSDMLNHYFCGQRAFELLPEESPMRTIIADHYDVYRLGTQGPDFFYYDFPIPLPGHYPTTQYGSLIHRQRINDFFIQGLAYAKSHPWERDVVLSYLAGFLSHHALDTATHPFIFYRTGCYDRHFPPSRIYSYFHKRYEVLLDVANLRYVFNQWACHFNAEKIFTLSPQTEEILDLFYSHILRCVYGVSPSPHSFKKSLHNTRRIVRHTADATGSKKWALSSVERLVGEEHALSRVFYPADTDIPLVLNLNHSSWRHPVTGAFSSDSYVDLFNRGTAQTVTRIQALDTPKITNAHVIPPLLQDHSYLTDLPWEDDREMQYFDFLFHQHPELL